MDYESAYSRPSPWYVSYSSNRLSCRLKWLPEARANQKFVVVNQRPTSRATPSALRFDGEKKDKTNVGRDDTPNTGSPEEWGDTESDFELQVRVERSVVLDGGLQDKDSEGRDFDASPSVSHKSVSEQEYNV
jgi:hypothetical protein